MTDPDKLFDNATKIGRLRKIVFDLLKEHEAEGPDSLPTNARFLYYELVQRRVLQKKRDDDQNGGRRSDQNLHDALTDLREVGVIPWHWIDDETRSLRDHTGWLTVHEWATTTVKYVRLCPWRGRAPMILTESRAVAGVLRKLMIEYAVKVAAVGGHCAGFLRNKIAPALNPGDTVLFVGDWDWQGAQIEANTRKVLEELIGGKLNWTRIALTEAQVDDPRYDLRSMQIMKIDRRYKRGQPGYRFPAVEAEALKQHVLVQIVRDALDELLPETLERVRERERRQRREIERRLRAGGR
jgi:hypothetical protein